MHLLVTDVVTCPRCGPEFGLVVLADRIESRHVLQGSLGCANCREQYPVRGGVADLRWGGSEGRAPQPPPSSGDAEQSYRWAALLGITGPAGPVAIVTGEPRLVDKVQGHLPDSGVIGVSPASPGTAGEVGMGWLLASGGLPFRTRSLGGVVLAVGDPLPLVEEALRCLARDARLVIDPAPAGATEKLLESGADLLLEQEQVAVAFDPRAG